MYLLEFVQNKSKVFTHRFRDSHRDVMVGVIDFTSVLRSGAAFDVS